MDSAESFLLLFSSNAPLILSTLLLISSDRGWFFSSLTDVGALNDDEETIIVSDESDKLSELSESQRSVACSAVAPKRDDRRALVLSVWSSIMFAAQFKPVGVQLRRDMDETTSVNLAFKKVRYND